MELLQELADTVQNPARHGNGMIEGLLKVNEPISATNASLKCTSALKYLGKVPYLSMADHVRG